MNSRRQTGWIIALMSVACIGLIIRHGHPGKTALSPGNRHLAASAMNEARNANRGQIDQTGVANDPQRALQQGSLRGTAADGDVTLGFAGQLKPDRALRQLFDYYLSLVGETDLPGVRELLRKDLLHRRLPAPVADEVLQTFDRYVGYQQAAVALAHQPGMTLQDQLPQLEALRRQMLGDDVAQAFYGEEQAQQERQLQRLAISQDQTLSPADRAQRLQTLDADIPASEREARTQASVGQLVQQQTTLLDEANATPAARHAERAQVWGDAVADRLAQLDQQRAQWQSRLATYNAQRKSIRNDDSLDPVSRQTALQQLLQTSFHGTEQLQVQAMASNGLMDGNAR